MVFGAFPGTWNLNLRLFKRILTIFETDELQKFSPRTIPKGISISETAKSEWRLMASIMQITVMIDV